MARGGGARHGPQALVRGAWIGFAGAQAVDEFQAADEVLGDGYFAPVVGAPFEGTDAQQVLLEINIGGAQGQGFGDPAAAQRQGEGQGLHFGARGHTGGGNECRAFLCGEVFAAAAVDEAGGWAGCCWHSCYGKCFTGGDCVVVWDASWPGFENL